MHCTLQWHRKQANEPIITSGLRMYLMHVYLQLQISRSDILTMHYKSYRTVPQAFRHNSGTIVYVTGL